jgi:hypothetical protein
LPLITCFAFDRGTIFPFIDAHILISEFPKEVFVKSAEYDIL